MGIFKRSQKRFALVMLLLGISSSTFATESGCATLDLQPTEPTPISATIEEISELMGIDVAMLEWATATNPLFTVIVDGQTIPYHEFGPESEEDLFTDSGLILRPNADSIEIELPNRTISRFDLTAIPESKSMPFTSEGLKTGHGQTEWIWVPIAIGGSLGCTGLTELCQQRCSSRVAECGECGGWCDCDWCGRGSHGCFPCPSSPPRENRWIGF